MIRQVTTAKYISLIMDDSTDVSVEEQEMVYVRSCHAGVVHVNFVGIIATPKADAEGIKKQSGGGYHEPAGHHT